MNVTNNFIVQEFDCRDGTPYPADWINTRLLPLCKVLEKVREEIDSNPVHIISGYRTPYHNKRVGGARRSKHLSGIAADIMSKDVPPEDIFNVFNHLIMHGEVSDGGLSLYSWGVHYDTRGHRARW